MHPFSKHLKFDYLHIETEFYCS